MTYDPATDLYVRLGVAHDAPIAVIKSVYRLLIRKAHPDIHGKAGHAASQLLNEAWDILGDEGERAKYDAARRLHHDKAPRPASAPRTAPPPGQESRRARRPGRAGAPKTEHRARRRASTGAMRWEDHVRPHPTKPYVEVDQEAIVEAINLIADLVEMWLKRRRDPTATPG